MNKLTNSGRKAAIKQVDLKYVAKKGNLTMSPFSNSTKKIVLKPGQSTGPFPFKNLKTILQANFDRWLMKMNLENVFGTVINESPEVPLTIPGPVLDILTRNKDVIISTDNVGKKVVELQERSDSESDKEYLERLEKLAKDSEALVLESTEKDDTNSHEPVKVSDATLIDSTDAKPEDLTSTDTEDANSEDLTIDPNADEKAEIEKQINELIIDGITVAEHRVQTENETKRAYNSRMKKLDQSINELLDSLADS